MLHILVHQIDTEIMKRKVRVGCISVIAYCVITVLIMHFAIGEGFFGIIGAFSTLHGGNPGYVKWHYQVIDDVTAPVQLPMLVTLYVSNALADRIVPSRRADIAYRREWRRYAECLRTDFDHCLAEAETIVLTNPPVREAWADHVSPSRNISPKVRQKLAELSLKRPEYMQAFYPVWYDLKKTVDERLAAVEVIAASEENRLSRSAVYAVLGCDAVGGDVVPDEVLNEVANRYPGHIGKTAKNILQRRKEDRIRYAAEKTGPESK